MQPVPCLHLTPDRYHDMENEYVANGQRVVLIVDPSVVAVRFRQPAKLSMRAVVAESHGLGSFRDRLELPREKFTLLAVRGTPFAMAERLHSVIRSLDQASEVTRVAAVFRVGLDRVVATDRVFAGFRPGSADPRRLLGQLGYEVLHCCGDGDEFLVRIGEFDDPLAVSRHLRSLPDVEYAEPDFLVVGAHLPRSPVSAEVLASVVAEDPLARFQYALGSTRADEAHGLRPGDRSVRIAILDVGVDSEHPDLKPVLVDGYDATDDDTYQQPNSHDWHGTACAGLAAAAGFNGIGVRGIGAGCGLMAVRIACSPRAGAPWVSPNCWKVRGIDWAWRSGAAVLSNSWNAPPSTAVTRALERARTRGRGGRGCVVVVAAGNASAETIGAGVTFPGSLPDVLTVGACTADDRPKTFDSRDGEPAWSSTPGPEVDIAAPGVKNYTTDISGKRGADTSRVGDYVKFSGTSSAAAIVAGAAGLVLSANPQLSEKEVRDMLCSTADKVPREEYDAGVHSHRMGFGRLNVFCAVKKALGSSCS